MLLDRLSQEEEDANPARDGTTWFISEKYDGWRMVYDAATDTYYSRSGEVIDVPPRMRTEMYRLNPAGYNLDGELFLGYGRFSDIRGALNAQSKQLTYRVFDIPNPLASYAQRYKGLENIFQSSAEKTKYIYLVQQTRMESLDLDKARNMMREVVGRGGEGVVVRLATGLYLPGQRSKEVLKLKPFDADEVEIVGYHQTTKATAGGYVSSLVCKLLDGTEKTFRVTYKSFDAPAIGTRVRIQYQSVTSTGLPRFPALLRSESEPSQPSSLRLFPSGSAQANSPLPEPGKMATEDKKSSPELAKTMAEWKALGGYRLLPGEAVSVISGSDPTQTYIVKCAQQDPSSIYCSCEAWKYQHLNPRVRTCKHCIAVCGAATEKRRVAFATLQLESVAFRAKNYKI